MMTPAWWAARAVPGETCGAVHACMHVQLGQLRTQLLGWRFAGPSSLASSFGAECDVLLRCVEQRGAASLGPKLGSLKGDVRQASCCLTKHFAFHRQGTASSKVSAALRWR